MAVPKHNMQSENRIRVFFILSFVFWFNAKIASKKCSKVGVREGVFYLLEIKLVDWCKK